MSSVYHRYEAAVKLSNGRVVIYHNINTGLKKFYNRQNEMSKISKRNVQKKEKRPN